jgi:hypothetical protein
MVPPFDQMFGRNDNYKDRCDDWLARMFKMRLKRTGGHEVTAMPAFYIANGLSPRGVYHSTIYSFGSLVHDPHFSDDGIEHVEWTWHLELL